MPVTRYGEGQPLVATNAETVMQFIRSGRSGHFIQFGEAYHKYIHIYESGEVRYSMVVIEKGIHVLPQNDPKHDILELFEYNRQWKAGWYRIPLSTTATSAAVIRYACDLQPKVKVEWRKRSVTLHTVRLETTNGMVTDVVMRTFIEHLQDTKLCDPLGDEITYGETTCCIVLPETIANRSELSNGTLLVGYSRDAFKLLTGYLEIVDAHRWLYVTEPHIKPVGNGGAEITMKFFLDYAC